MILILNLDHVYRHADFECTRPLFKLQIAKSVYMQRCIVRAFGPNVCVVMRAGKALNAPFRTLQQLIKFRGPGPVIK